MTRIALDLSAEVQTASGARYRWDANQAPGSRLRNLSFSTKIGEGFSSASGQLARRIDLDYPDLNLVDTVALIGADGSVAFEGRSSAMPHELTDTHSIGITLTGWMAHTKERRFTEIYVDRDMGAWGDMGAQRRANLLVGNLTPIPPQTRTDAAATVVETAIADTWVAPYVPISESWYDAGPGVSIGRLTYSWARAGATGSIAPWFWQTVLSTDDKATTTTASGNLVAAGPVANASLTGGSGNRYAYAQMFFNSTPGGAAGAQYGIAWSKLAVYGTHGLTLTTGEPAEPPGVFASDVIENLAGRFCPQLDTSGVQQTSYVIQHLAFKDPTFPFDAFLEVNKYHLWQLAVWENRRLVFAPYDLTDYDWEIRTDDPGTTFSPQGPSVDDLCSGIAVTYQDALTGTQNRLTPDAFPADLATTDPENPWRKHGVDHWEEITLSTPTIQAQALQLGRAALAEKNTPKTPGTITVQGYIRDRQGHQQPVWKVRAGDTISVTNFPNDSPRLIVETDYNDESKEISLSIDRPFAMLDAYLDRVGVALSARGLG